MNKVVLYLPLFYPNEKIFYEILKKINDMKIDYVEIGFPSKNPYLDGEIISNAHIKILEKKYSNKNYLDALLKIKISFSFKIILMGYYNEFINFSVFFDKKNYKKYFDAMLCVDLPNDKTVEYNIPIINELDSEKSIMEKIKYNPLFVYVMSSIGKTGSGTLKKNYIDTIKKLKKIKNINSFVGFQIKTAEDIKSVLENGADGAIIGSEFIKQIDEQNIDIYLRNICG